MTGLVLFDVDGTLLHARGAGMRMLREAASELFGRPFPNECDLAGRIDPLIFRMLCAANGVEHSEEHEPRFRAIYGRKLAALLASGHPVRLLAGVEQSLAALGRIDDLTLGLLTGNYPETGRLKIAAAGLDPERFPVCAWGSDGRRREDLPPVAMHRYAEHTGRSIAAGRVVVVGDTPHDVACAHANGCRAVAVATGRYAASDLATADADCVLADLTDPSALVAAIGSVLG